MQSRRDKSRDVRHVYHEVGADLLGDGCDFFKIDDARIGGSAGDNELRFCFERGLAQLVVVDASCLCIHAVRNKVEIGTRHVDGRTMRQMAAMREIHAEHGIAGLQQRKIDRHIRLRAAVRLHICMLGTEEPACSVTGYVFHNVDAFAAAVIPLAGVAFRIFIGQNASHGCHHSLGNKIFGGDELDAAALTGQLCCHRFSYFRIVFRYELNGFVCHFYLQAVWTAFYIIFIILIKLL